MKAIAISICLGDEVPPDEALRIVGRVREEISEAIRAARVRATVDVHVFDQAGIDAQERAFKRRYGAARYGDA